MLKKQHIDIIKKILQNRLGNSYEYFLFGSRANGRNAPYSDCDIGVKGNTPLSWRTRALLREDFTNTKLPMEVDIIDWQRASSRFRAIAEKQIIYF